MSIQQDPTHPTGIADDSPRGSGQAFRARNRKAAAALSMRVEGAEWDEIAEVLGYPDGDRAQVAVEGALEREMKTEESRKHLRMLMGRQINRLVGSAWTKATDPDHPEHLAAMDRVLRAIDRKAKLYGVDAPTEFVVATPTIQELEQWVAEVTQHTMPALEEGNIFDGEIVEDTGDKVNDPSELHTVNPGEEA